MSGTIQPEKRAHFKGKDAVEHVVEAQAQGILSSAEIHGTEIPGHISSAADTAREMALILLIFGLVFVSLSIPFTTALSILALVAFSWATWKIGRSAWLAWFRLERMHRVVEQERWEIQHHRQQEREELKELYRAKGFEGKLLEDVLDVLMADEERLLRVMVEEELCLSLGTQEHPLKQACGAGLGAAIAIFFCLAGFYLFAIQGLWISSFAILGSAAALSAYYSENNLVSAIAWNLGLGALSVGGVYFLLEYV